MKKLLTLTFSFLFSASLFATHIVGQEIYYDYVSGNTYDVYLKLYTDPGAIPLPTTWNLTVTGHPSITSLQVVQTTSTTFPACGAGVYTVALYKATINLGPIPASGLEISYSTCCRAQGISNISTTNFNIYISTKMIPLPGTTVCSSSARFLEDTFLNGQPSVTNVYNSVAQDPNPTDSIYVSLTPAQTTSTINVNYLTGYSASNPFGTATGNTTIDSKTGLMHVTGANLGTYTVSTTVQSYTNGFLTSTMKRDLRMYISSNTDSVPTVSLTNITTGGTVSSSSDVYTIEMNETDTLEFDVVGLTPNLSTVTLNGFGLNLIGSNGIGSGNNSALITANGGSFSGVSSASGHFAYVASPTIFLPGETVHFYNFMMQASIASTCGEILTDNIAVHVKVNKTQSIFGQNNYTICQGGMVQTQITGDTTNLSWSPTTGVSQPSSATPYLSPSATTSYTVTNNNDGSQITVLVTVDSLTAPTLSSTSTHASLPNASSFDLVVWYYNGAAIALNVDSVAMIISGDYFAYVEKGACSAFSDTITKTFKNQIPLNGTGSGSTILVDGDGKYSLDFKVNGYNNELASLYLILPDTLINKTTTPPDVEIKDAQNNVVANATAVLIDGVTWEVTGLNAALATNQVYTLEMEFDAGTIALFKPTSFAYTEPTNNVEVLSATYEINGAAQSDAFPFVVFGVKSGIGIAENQWDARIYPNPMADVLHIDLQGTATFELFDVAGRRIISTTLEGKTQVNTAELPAGVYVYEINSAGKTAMGKLVK